MLSKLTELIPVTGFAITQIDPGEVAGPVGALVLGVYVAVYTFQAFSPKTANGSSSPLLAIIQEDVSEVKATIRTMDSRMIKNGDKLIRMEGQVARNAEVIRQNNQDVFREINRIRSEGCQQLTKHIGILRKLEDPQE